MQYIVTKQFIFKEKTYPVNKILIQEEIGENNIRRFINRGFINPLTQASDTKKPTQSKQKEKGE